MATPESMFDLPEEEKKHVVELIDTMIADMQARADEFLTEVDEARDQINAVADQLSPAEVERRDLVTGVGQMSAEYALVPLRFLKQHREALLRNGPDLIFLLRDIIVNGQEGTRAAVETYQANIDAAARAQDEEDPS